MKPSNRIPNQVLTDDAKTSSNFWTSDRILQHHLSRSLTREALDFLTPKLEWMGEQAAVQMDDLSITADCNEPELIKRDPLGESRNEVSFHPAYRELLEFAARSEMLYLKYEPSLKKTFTGQRHRMGFALGQLYAMSELGVFCPLCMTDGAAWLLEQHAPEEIRERLIPRLSANTGEELFTGAMFLTEKSGGSDVGRNTASAEKISGHRYRLNGEKWFCSNVNAEVILALARTDPDIAGTRGLSLFLIERYPEADPYGELEIVRMKEKLGVRSMATGEVLLKDTEATRIGEEEQGFKIMTGMINMSRIYNSIGALAGMRRAIAEAWQYLNYRILFDERAVEKPLIRTKFHELGGLYLGNFFLVWRTLEALDKYEAGDESEGELLRVLVPMAKWWSADSVVYAVRECMELQGGNGYIEKDFVMPKLFRDVNVLPIWEGSGNVIVLDILRAMQKSKGMDLLLAEMEETFAGGSLSPAVGKIWEKTARLTGRLEELDPDQTEATAKPLFKTLIQLVQLHLVMQQSESDGKAARPWLEPARRYLEASLAPEVEPINPIPLDELKHLIGWNI